MKNTQKETIKELERLIQIKEEIIKELERQNQIIKNQPPITIPINPQPFIPNPQPVNPWQPWSPNQPWWGPTIISSTFDSASITFEPSTTKFTLIN